MSKVLKINKGNKANIKIRAANGGAFSGPEDTQDQMQLQIHNAYQKGLNEGYKKAVKELQNKFDEEIKHRDESLNNFITGIDEKIKNYEADFNNVVINLSFMIAEKIIRESVEKNPSVNKVLSESMKKILGANSVIIKLNEKDLNVLSGENRNLINDGSFSKIKFESDDSIEPGGCLIETDIGNVDGRISTQMKELRKVLDQKILMTDQEDAD